MKSFVIQCPWALWLLLLMVPLSALLARARRKRAELGERLGVGVKACSRMRDWLRVIAMGLLLLALARPGYAPERRAILQSGRDVVFAIDVSRSMLAEDAHPSRLEAAKQGVRDALERFGSERAGLVIYAGSATILCPLTYDYDFVRYMLEQAVPRAVDFGGSTLLSAVEKSVDNIFTDERKGMQDLVVLTDGEDHGPEMQRVAALLKEHGVDLLLVGLGDAEVGTRIPVENDEGGVSYLKFEEEFVSTQLREDVLRNLASQLAGASYVGPGTAAFDLGGLYAAYVEGKPVSGAIGSETFVVYQEGGFALIGIALVLLLVAATMRITKPALALFLAAFFVPVNSHAGWLEDGFQKARKLQEAGRHREALEAYVELESQMHSGNVSPRQSAAVLFNQALCHLGQADAVSTESPEAALAAARMAQRCFLEALRMDKGLERAGMRLDSTASMIALFAHQVEVREIRDQMIQEKLSALIERLKKLLEDQTAFHVEILTGMPKRASTARRRGQKEAPIPPPTPQTAPAILAVYVDQQNVLTGTGLSILAEMKEFDHALSSPLPEGMPPMESIMSEPLRWMGQATDAQQEAERQLEIWATWEAASARQKLAMERIQRILDLLEGGKSTDLGESALDEEDGEMEEYDASDESTSSSIQTKGELAADSELQELPIPNYNANDLLLEEQGNLQFRQQQRAKAQAGKVKKDW